MPTITTSRLIVGAVIATAALAVTTSCGADGATSTSPSSGAAGAITVSAAASLTESFTRITSDFVAEHPDAEITFNFGSSGQLTTQIEQGAPADVAAFANTQTMALLETAGLLDQPPRIFATNQLVIVTKPGNPNGIESLAGLANAGIIALCSNTAPCGSFADQVLADARVSIARERITRGQDVVATLTAATQGDADAAIVYLTDAVAAGDAVDVVEIPEAQNVVAEYPIAVIADSANAALAESFQAYVLSEEGQRTLRDAGFGSP